MKNKYLLLSGLFVMTLFAATPVHAKKKKKPVKQTTDSLEIKSEIPREIVIKADPVTSDKSVASVKSANIKHCIPIVGKVISPFGNARAGHRHTGTDIKLAHGDTVRAACCGVVTMACPYAGYGKLIVIQHQNQIETYYSHLSKCIVSKGDTVNVGEAIGLGGRTGRATTNHLHFEIRKKKVPVNAEKFFNFASGALRLPLFDDGILIAENTSPKAEIVIHSDNSDKSIRSVGEIKIKSDKVVLKDSSYSVTNTASKDSVVAENLPDEVEIKAGDTLYSLARKYSTTVKHLQELNGMTDNKLKIGMKLKMR